MEGQNEQFCDYCKHLVCAVVWGKIVWQCTKGERRRELEFSDTHALRRQRCIRERWFEPRSDAPEDYRQAAPAG